MDICGNVTIQTGIRYRLSDFSFGAAENCTTGRFDSWMHMGGGNTVQTDVVPFMKLKFQNRNIH